MLKKSVQYSQNFIKDPNLVERLLSNSSIGKNDVVLEIGAGGGVITRKLRERAKEVIAFEIDNDLPLKDVVRGDFLDHPLPNYPYKVFSNIPFNITADIVKKTFVFRQSTSRQLSNRAKKSGG